jgi:ATP-dependent Clp protease adaptor protein ClpS
MPPVRRDDDEGGIGTIDRTDARNTTKTRNKTEKPPKYKVLLHNDDFTPVELVLLVLEKVFKMNARQAFDVMKTAHTTGLCLCGVYPHEIAEQRTVEATDLARKEGYALRFSIEKE